MKLTLEQVLNISALVDKLDIKIDSKAEVEEVGTDVILQVIKKAHTAKDEVIELVSSILNCKKEDALKCDLLGEWQKFKNSERGKEMVVFFKSASQQKAQD